MTAVVHVIVPAPEADVAADALWRAGAAAIEERPGLLIAAAASDGPGGGDPAPLLAAVAGRWPAEVRAVDLDDALDAWRPYARAVIVGGRLVVRPPWVARPDDPDGAPDDPGSAPCGPPGSGGLRRPGPGGAAGGRREVVIDPGRAFGHGAHPSTRLALAALVDLVTGGERVLDVGCGSGVLAIAALALGAGSAVGVDTDPAALVAARGNAARNGVAARLQVVGHVGALGRAGGRDGPNGPFDLVVANMLLPDLVSVAPAVAATLAPTGTAVVSGVLAAQRADLVAAYEAAGLAPCAEREDEGWLALTLRAG